MRATPSLWPLDDAGRPVMDAVTFAGDWHGDWTWGTEKIGQVSDIGLQVILHVGDFGIWPGPHGKRYLTKLEEVCTLAGVVIAVTPGNHEDWVRLSSRTARDRGDGLGPVIALTDHIVVFPRGARFSLATPGGIVRSFVALGGAPSIDFEYRTAGRDWWPEEMITPGDVDRVVNGGYADVMIAHDSPDVPYATPQVEQILRSNPMGWSVNALSYAAQGRHRMTQAFEGVAPRVFVHGHFHVGDRARVPVRRPDGDGTCTVVSLADQHKATNMAMLDLEPLAIR